ncbi:MAG: RNA polymerase sigma factor [Chloroflexi bacterium]|nr:RNA polymerase sigma factor [Chloroflexota bacterium]
MYNSEERVTDLLRAALGGDDSAVEALFRQFSPAVFRLAASLLNDADDAEEVTQDTFVYALKNLGHYDPARSALQTWLFTIAVSRCRNKRRRKWLETVPLAWFARHESRRGSIRSLEDWLAARGVQRELWAAVQALSPKLREAVLLRFVGDLPYAEIGEAVGCGAKAAESRVRTGIVALRKQLAAPGAPQEEWLEALDAT